jgi:ribosome biogenesis GTPase / thiamine phosphate phosphatase
LPVRQAGFIKENAVFTLQELGWCEFFRAPAAQELQGCSRDQFAEALGSGLVPARVAEENRGLYRLYCEPGEFLGELSGKLRHASESRADLPVVGDWVLAQLRRRESRATIQHALRRKGKFSRKAPGRKTEEQIIAANIDVLFLVSSLNRDFNPRRIERYLTLAWDSGARPVIVLNKADLGENAETFRREAEAACMGARVVLTSATRGDGLEELRAILRGAGANAGSDQAPEQSVTAALLGSSGVGKSSLINALMGDAFWPGGRLATQAVREADDRGRHTTTSREMLLVPGGGVVIDTPGMRELALWGAADGIGRTFGDIQELAARCKFRDCCHQGEPGCAVRAAVEARTLDAERVESFHKLEREEQFLEAKQDAALRAQRKKELRQLMKSVNRFYRERGH